MLIDKNGPSPGQKALVMIISGPEFSLQQVSGGIRAKKSWKNVWEKCNKTTSPAV